MHKTSKHHFAGTTTGQVRARKDSKNVVCEIGETPSSLRYNNMHMRLQRVVKHPFCVNNQDWA